MKSRIVRIGFLSLCLLGLGCGETVEPKQIPDEEPADTVKLEQQHAEAMKGVVPAKPSKDE